MRIHPRHTALLFAFLMSLCMAFLMSGVLTALNLGLNLYALQRWPHNFLVAWPVAFPSVLLLAPRVRQLVAWLTRPE